MHVFCLAATEPANTCARGAQLDAAHHTEQRGTQQSPEAEMYYVCHRVPPPRCSITCLPARSHAGSPLCRPPLGTQAAGAGVFSRLTPALRRSRPSAAAAGRSLRREERGERSSHEDEQLSRVDGVQGHRVRGQLISPTSPRAAPYPPGHLAGTERHDERRKSTNGRSETRDPHS